MKTKFWLGFFIGLGIGLILGLTGASVWFYVIAGSVPLIGRMIQSTIRKKTGIKAVQNALKTENTDPNLPGRKTRNPYGKYGQDRKD